MAKYKKVTCNDCGAVFERDTGLFAKQPEPAGFLGLGYRCRSCVRANQRKKREAQREQETATRRQLKLVRSAEGDQLDSSPTSMSNTKTHQIEADATLDEVTKEAFWNRLFVGFFVLFVFSAMTYGLYVAFKNSRSLIWEIFFGAGLLFSIVATFFALFKIPKRALAVVALLALLIFVMRIA